MDEMKPLIAQARAEGKWLVSNYQDIWFSPDQLEAEHANGRFRWGPVNWTLRDPRERVHEADLRLQAAQDERDRIAAQMRAP